MSGIELRRLNTTFERFAGRDLSYALLHLGQVNKAISCWIKFSYTRKTSITIYSKPNFENDYHRHYTKSGFKKYFSRRSSSNDQNLFLESGCNIR